MPKWREFQSRDENPWSSESALLNHLKWTLHFIDLGIQVSLIYQKTILELSRLQIYLWRACTLLSDRVKGVSSFKGSCILIDGAKIGVYHIIISRSVVYQMAFNFIIKFLVLVSLLLLSLSIVWINSDYLQTYSIIRGYWTHCIDQVDLVLTE